MLVALAAFVIGLIAWLAAGNPKIGEAGRILMAIGMLLLVWMLSTDYTRFLPR